MNEHENQRAFASSQPQAQTPDNVGNQRPQQNFHPRGNRGGKQHPRSNGDDSKRYDGTPVANGHPIRNRFEYILGQLISSGVYLGRDTPAEDSQDIVRMLQVAQEINEKIGAYYTKTL